MYAADMGGQVWSFDIYQRPKRREPRHGRRDRAIGQAASRRRPRAATRRFYYSPDVAMVATKDYHFVHVGIGSGHRAHPLRYEPGSLLCASRLQRLRQVEPDDVRQKRSYKDAS